MTSSDIAKAMLVKKESLRVARNRLKKKLGLDSGQLLFDFVQEYELLQPGLLLLVWRFMLSMVDNRYTPVSRRHKLLRCPAH